MYSVYTSRYMYVPTQSTFGEVDPFCLPNRRKSLGINTPLAPKELTEKIAAEFYKPLFNS